MSASRGGANKIPEGKPSNQEIDPRHKWLYQRPSPRVNPTQRFEKPSTYQKDNSLSKDDLVKKFNHFIYESDSRVAKYLRKDTKRLIWTFILVSVAPFTIPTVNYQVIQPIRKISTDFISWVKYNLSGEDKL